MKSVEDIKRFFQKSTLSTNKERHEAIFEEIQRAQCKSKTTAPASYRLNLRSNIMKSSIIKSAAAAVIIIAAMLGINYISGSPDGASVAWADVLKNIEAARTLTYIFEIEKGDMREVFKTSIKEPYLQRNDVIESPSDFKVSLRNAGSNRRWILYPNTKMAVVNDDEGSVGDEIRAYEGLKKDFRDGTEKNLGRVELNGRGTICFEISKDNKKITIWADPNTALPVQIEEISEENGNKWRALRSDIRFDEEMDDQLFAPPADYCILDLKTQQLQTPFELTEQHLIEGLAVYPKYLDGKFCTRYIGGRPLTEEVRKKCKAEVEKIESWSDIEAHKSTLGCAFIEKLPEGSDYQYVGEDVKLGDTNTPVCWWKPPDSKTYRVVYGDLSIRDVEPGDLPEIPWLKK
jgi:outer membrane lipoprotein-sorting protein